MTHEAVKKPVAKKKANGKRCMGVFYFRGDVRHHLQVTSALKRLSVGPLGWIAEEFVNSIPEDIRRQQHAEEEAWARQRHILVEADLAQQISKAGARS